MYFGLNWTQAKQNKEQERDGEWSRRVPFPCNGKMAFHPLQLYFCPFLLAQTTISGPIGRWRSKRVKNGNFEFGFRKAREKKTEIRLWFVFGHRHTLGEFPSVRRRRCDLPSLSCFPRKCRHFHRNYENFWDLGVEFIEIEWSFLVAVFCCIAFAIEKIASTNANCCAKRSNSEFRNRVTCVSSYKWIE